MSILLTDKDPKDWGPHFWYMIETIADSYPEKPSPELQQQTVLWFHAFRFLLPCSNCRKHFDQYIGSKPIATAVTSKKMLVLWVNQMKVSIENLNKQQIETTKKPAAIPTSRPKGIIPLPIKTRTMAMPKQHAAAARVAAIQKKNCGCGKKKKV